MYEYLVSWERKTTNGACRVPGPRPMTRSGTWPSGRQITSRPCGRREGRNAALNPSMALEARWRWCSTSSTVIEQRCALGAKPVLQCPVGAKGCRDSAAASRVGRALVDQVPALTASSDKPGQHALLRHPAPVRELRAPSERLDAPRHLLNQRLGTGRYRHTPAPRAACHRRLERIESLNGPAHSRRALHSARLALRRRTLSCARILPNRPSASPSRSIAVGAPLQTPAHLVHLEST